MRRPRARARPELVVDNRSAGPVTLQIEPERFDYVAVALKRETWQRALHETGVIGELRLTFGML